MKFLFAVLASVLFGCSSLSAQDTYTNYLQYNFRPTHYQTQSQYRNNTRYNARVYVYNYRPKYYNTNTYAKRRALYNSYYNRNSKSFTNFFMNYYNSNR